MCKSRAKSNPMCSPPKTSSKEHEGLVQQHMYVTCSTQFSILFNKVIFWKNSKYPVKQYGFYYDVSNLYCEKMKIFKFFNPDNKQVSQANDEEKEEQIRMTE